MPKKHALLSASSASRWLKCPPSAKICAESDDTSSVYAEEGTLAHSICEVKLSAFVSATPKRTITSKLNKLKKEELYQSEMDSYTDEYTDYIKKLAFSFPSKAHIIVERQVDYSDYAPEGFGTADCIILHGDSLHIVDFKYGKGVPVSAEDNPQLKLYALGALKLYGMIYPIKNITLHIVQPRIDNFSEWSLKTEELVNWGNSIKPIAQLAFEGKGEYCSGEHCRFCKIAGSCRKRADDNLELAKYEFRMPLSNNLDLEEESVTLSDEEVGAVLTKAKRLKIWVESVEEYVLSSILKGRKIDGWKAVEGRGSRVFTDADAVPERLKSLNYSPDIAFERKQLTPAQLEKVLGKSEFNQTLGDLVQKLKGSPALAPITDIRPEYIQGTSAKDDFK